MIRFVLAAFAALALAACAPSMGKIDEQDPFATLIPWKHNWKEIQKLPSGVEYVVIRKGDRNGSFPSPADRVELRYDMRVAKSGESIESSYERGRTQVMRVTTQPVGWQYGIEKLQPGDEVMFWVPWEMAYGEEGDGVVPPKADLMIRTELLRIIPAVAPDIEAWAKVTPWPIGSSQINRKNSGLEYIVIESGDPDGVPASDGDFVEVHIEGRLEDETGDSGEPVVVESTFDDQQTIRFPIDELTDGWKELMFMMRPGDHWMVMMPPHLMYGSEGHGKILPNATVIYEVRLESVRPGFNKPDTSPPN
jgi:FKBP-type peptidyl-prolyl cis-trans isomerase